MSEASGPAIPDVARPPRWLFAIAVVVLLAGLTASFLGAFHIGVSWDETYHVQRLRNFLNRGWYLIDTEMNGFSPSSGNTSTYVYGPVAALTLHWLNLLLGARRPATSTRRPTPSPSATSVRRATDCSACCRPWASHASCSGPGAGRW